MGHSPLRLFVMGDDAYERAATATEIVRMAELVREGIAAGGAGFSTSFSFAHRGVDGKPVPGYREEPKVAGGSVTETYVALRTEIDSWRWAGVPFLLRTGKRLARRVTEIAVQFKLPPLRLFRTVECEGDF